MNMIATANNQKLGHDQIAGEHEILFDCIEQFVNALKAGKVRKVWTDLLSALPGWLKSHRQHDDKALVDAHPAPPIPAAA